MECITYETRILLNKSGYLKKKRHTVVSRREHGGIRKTERRVRERFDLGKGFHRKVRQYVKSCSVCPRSKAPQQKVGSLQPVLPPRRPFEKIDLDFAGPFNVPSNRPVYILVIVDSCMRYVHLFTSGRISARFVVRALETLSNTVGHLGTNVTDNATCFRGSVPADSLREVGTSHIRMYVRGSSSVQWPRREDYKGTDGPPGCTPSEKDVPEFGMCCRR